MLARGRAIRRRNARDTRGFVSLSDSHIDQRLCEQLQIGFSPEILSSQWISDFQATSDPAFDGSASDISGVMSTGRSSSLWSVAPHVHVQVV